MEIRYEVEPLGFGAATGVSVVAFAPSATPEVLADLFDTLEDVLRTHRFGPADIVRNRLIAASREERDSASAVRFARLSGPARCATSSYIAESFFPSGEGVRIDTIALRGVGATKVSVEHDPAQPPCRFVATTDHVFLSGLTSTEPDLHPQVRHIRQRLAETLALAEEAVGAAVRPFEATIYLHPSVGLDELVDLPELVRLVDVPLDFHRCDGFSKPGKLIEIEVDARVVREASA